MDTHDSTSAREGAQVIALPLTRDSAITAVLREHDRLAQVLMTTIDLLGDVQDGRVPPINLPNMRKAAGAMLRDSIQHVGDAATVLAGDER